MHIVHTTCFSSESYREEIFLTICIYTVHEIIALNLDVDTISYDPLNIADFKGFLHKCHTYRIPRYLGCNTKSSSK